MASGFIRREVKTRLVELIRREIPDVAVDGHDPGRDIQNEHIYIGAVTGSVDYPVFAASTMPHDDQFVIVVVCWVLNRLDSGTASDAATAADTRCQQLLNAVNAAVSEHAGLSLANPSTAADPDLDGVIVATVANVEGPEAEPADEGWLAIAAVDIAVHTRMSNP